MKRIISLLLSLLLILSLAACGAPASEPAAIATPQSTSTPAPEEAVDPEVQRAIAHGLVPEEIQGDYDAPITFRQYSEMLCNLIRIWDESRMGEWEETIAAAAQSDDEMRREDGILEISYAMVLMGLTEQRDFDLDATPVQTIMDSGAQGPSWNYPLFPNFEDMAYEWLQSNYMWGGIVVCATKLSAVSFKAIFPLETDADFTRLQEPLTRCDAISAAVRLGEVDPSFLEPAGVYVSLGDVGTYDRSIITDTLLSAPSDLPDATQSTLPALWHGVGLSCCKDGHHTYRDFREADICFMAENGFNFARLFFGFSTLRFPDYPEDVYLVNENELRDLDQLIAWGIEHGVHIQIAMSFMPNGEPSLNVDEAEWMLMRTIWATLCRRYAGIPNRYLSFDIANELEPDEAHFDAAVSQLTQLYAQLRAIDRERVVLYSYQANPTIEFVEALAKIGYAVGCHPYYPQYITTTGYEYVEQNPYAEPLWPLPWFPMGEICEGRAPLTLQGEIGGTTLSLHVLDSYEKAALDVYADGALLEHIALTGGTVEDENRQYGDILSSVLIPAGTGKAEVWVREPHARIDTVIVEGSFGTVNIVPHDACDYLDYAVPLPLVINGDGSYTNSENRIIDGEEIYRADIQPYHEIANKYGVGFMIGEFGMFGTNIYWDISVVAAYHDSVLKMLTEKGFGWCYCELYNRVDKHIVLLGEKSQWANTTVKTVEVQYDGGVDTLYVNRELLDTFRKYTINSLAAY